MADFPVIPGDAFTPEQLALLEAPLDAQALKERVGAGGAKLKYIDGRYAIQTANRIFGKGKWGFRITSRSHERIEKNDGSYQEYFTADIELYVSGNPFPFPGDGIGAVKSNTVEGIEMARKDAVTDALKRALVYYGSQFGLDLRDKEGEALVDMGEGVLVQVKEVQINKTGDNTLKPSAAARINAAPEHRQIAAPAARVVDSVPASTQPKPIASIPTFNGLRKVAVKYLDEMTFNAVLKDFNRDHRILTDREYTPEEIVKLRDILTPMINEAKQAQAS